MPSRHCIPAAPAGRCGTAAPIASTLIGGRGATGKYARRWRRRGRRRRRGRGPPQGRVRDRGAAAQPGVNKMVFHCLGVSIGVIIAPRLGVHEWLVNECMPTDCAAQIEACRMGGGGAAHELSPAVLSAKEASKADFLLAVHRVRFTARELAPPLEGPRQPRALSASAGGRALQPRLSSSQHQLQEHGRAQQASRALNSMAVAALGRRRSAVLALALMAAACSLAPAEGAVAEIGPTASRRFFLPDAGPFAVGRQTTPCQPQPHAAPAPALHTPRSPRLPPFPPCQIFIGGVQDLQPDGSGASKCSRLVDAALSYDAFSRAQFLVSGGCARVYFSSHVVRGKDGPLLILHAATHPVCILRTCLSPLPCAPCSHVVGQRPARPAARLERLRQLHPVQ